MASISTSADGRRIIQFAGEDGRRRTVRLGKLSMKIAEEVCRRIEFLTAAAASGVAPDPETVRWLATISEKLHKRLAADHKSG